MTQEAGKRLTASEMLEKHDVAIDRWPDTKLLIEKAMEEYAQSREQPWVRVEAALPERATPVICYWGIGSFQDEGDMTIEDLVDDKGDRLERTWPVTHWMPLPPAPPKD